MGEWYFESWKDGGQAAETHGSTEDFAEVLATCKAAIADGKIFRIRAPAGADRQHLQELAKAGAIERI